MPASTAVDAKRVRTWETVFDLVQPLPGRILGSNFAGWISSADGLQLPDEHMRDWISGTLRNIGDHKVDRVLEIGCGNGILLSRLARHCGKYVGVDISSYTLSELQQAVENEGLTNVELHHARADNVGEILGSDIGFDLVLVNSVAQYFPSPRYAKEALLTALNLVKPGGKLFVGDVRSYPLLTQFYASLEMCSLEEGATRDDLNRRIKKRFDAEKEMAYDPGFFFDLAEGANSVHIMPKLGWLDNEMSKYRYDVAIVKGKPPEKESCEWHAWSRIGSLDALCAKLATKPAIFAVSQIPNSRLLQDAAQLAAIGYEHDSFVATATDNAVHPEALIETGMTKGYRTYLNVSLGSSGAYDALFIHSSREEDQALNFPSSRTVASVQMTNDPLKFQREERDRRIQATLQAHVSSLLPKEALTVTVVIED